MTFIEGSGFALWADTNRLVILFPQGGASLLNPKACWDWWGYTGKNFGLTDGGDLEDGSTARKGQQDYKRCHSIGVEPALHVVDHPRLERVTYHR